MSTSSSRQSTAAPSWSAERSEAVDPREHRWQGAPRKNARTRVPTSRRRRVRLILMLGLLAGTFALFVNGLLFAPVKTPLIIVASTEFADPVPPNAWTREDVERLKALDEKTFRVADTSAAWHSKQSGLEEFDKQWDFARRKHQNDGAVVFYISLPGLVDDDGVPCLLLPGGSPWNSSQWLPLSDLLDRAAGAGSEELQKIVLLDCTRTPADWNLGVVRNTFVDRVGELVRRRKDPHLHVITASGPGETAWASSELEGSAFGRAVAAALAGECDRTPSRAKIGNRNGRVSLRELHRYVAERVGDWATHNRGMIQTPQLYSGAAEDAADFRVAWALARRSQLDLDAAEAIRAPSADAVSIDARAGLWRRLDTIRDAAPYRAHPLVWRELEHGLLRLEQLSRAGEAYRDEAQKLAASLGDRLDRAVARVAAGGTSKSFAAGAAVLDADDDASPSGLKHHGLAAARRFGAIDEATAASLAERFLSATGRIDQTIYDDDLRKAGLTPPTMESQYVKMIRRYRVLDRRKDPALLRRGLELHLAMDGALVDGDARADFWTAPAQAAADAARRTALDRLLGAPDLQAEVWAETERQWRRVGDAPGGLRHEIENAVAVRDRVAAEAVYLADWLCAAAPHHSLESLAAPAPPPTKSNAPPTATATGSAATLPAVRASTSAMAGAKPKPSTPSSVAPSRLTAPAPTAATEADRIVIGRLAPLLAKLRALGEAIDDRRQPATDSLPGFVATARELDAEWSAFKQLYLDAVAAALARPSPDGATLAELENALGVPWLPADRRQQATRKVAELAAQLHDLASGPAAGGKPTTDPNSITPGDDANRRTGLDERIVAWRPHPLSIVLGVDGADDAIRSASSADERLSAIEKLQAACRGRLLALAASSPADAIDAGADPRTVLSTAERSVRLAASLGFVPPADDPVRRLFTFDSQRLLLTHARRVLDDFWGTAGSDPIAPGESRPYFDTVVGDLVAAAEALAVPVGAVRNEIDSLERLSAARRAAARRGLSLRVEPALVDTNSADVAIDVVVARGAAVSAETASGDAGLPTAEGFVEVVARDVPLAMNTAAFSTPLSAEGTKARLSGPVPDAAGSSFDAVAVIRGNEFPTPFLRPGFGGVVIQADFKPLDTAQVTLFGDRPQQSSVMFILDCSSSMSSEMPVELVDADRLPRLEIAKGALNSLLEQLAVRADTRVGVRFFGHRAGWAKGELAKLMTQTDYSGPIPDDLAPAADVELILPLGRFDSVEAGIVSGRLRSVKPFGQSPLYLSLVESIRDFSADRDDSDKSIVVITDGANYQFTPAGSGTTPPPHQTIGDVLAAEQGKDVPIFILGFGTSDDEAAERDFTTLAERTGGKYFAVENGRDLLQTLRERLGLGSYRVETAGEGDAAKATKLNVAATVAGLTRGPATYAVRFQSSTADVLVEGGEVLELYASPGGRIASRPYDRRLPVEDMLTLEGSMQKFTVRAHRPKASAKIVQFPVSLQEIDAPFTRRPDEVWIEITPVVGGAADARPRYVFYDRQFEAGTPVPLAPCIATDWPAAAKRANVAVWCKYGRSEPFQSIALSDVQKDETTYAAGVPIRNDATGRLRVQLPDDAGGDAPVEIRVIEEHGPDSRGLHLLKVMLEGVPVDHVVRRFDDARGLASHTFRISPAAARRLDDARVTITARSAAHEGAFSIEAGRVLTVDIGGSGDVLPLDAATGVR